MPPPRARAIWFDTRTRWFRASTAGRQAAPARLHTPISLTSTEGAPHVRRQWIFPACAVRVLPFLRLVHVPVLGDRRHLPQQGPGRGGEDVLGVLRHHPPVARHPGLSHCAWP